MLRTKHQSKDPNNRGKKEKERILKKKPFQDILKWVSENDQKASNLQAWIGQKESGNVLCFSGVVCTLESIKCVCYNSTREIIKNK